MSRVAIRYSKALFNTALEKNKIDAVLSDLMEVQTLAEKNDRFAALLQNPLIQVNRKMKIITELFKGRVDDLTFSFLSLVTQKKRIDFLLEMISYFAARIDEHNGILNGQVYSAAEIPAAQVEEIKVKMESFTGKKVRLECRIDEQLIGGFVVKVRDTVIDLSVQGQLEKLRNKLVFG